MRFEIATLLIWCIVYVNSEIPIQPCPEGRSEGLKQEVSIERCHKPPCKFRKGTSPFAEFKFTPDRDVQKISNVVNALIVGLPFPFIGVDGTDACGQIFETDGTTKASCPLKAGHEYIYRTKIQVLEIYPLIKTVVQWQLAANDGKDVVCFRTPIRIVN